MDQPALERLAELLKSRNLIDAQIASLIGRPASTGHIGEWIAAQVFGVRLDESAVQRGSDGRFTEPPLSGLSVNIKLHGKRENILDLNESHVPDFYLVLTGPRAPAASSRGSTRPCLISEVFLFEAITLIQRLKGRGVHVGVATSVTAQEWESARVYPESRTAGPMRLRPDQAAALRLFSGV
jgi:hypothetical protein